MDRAALPTVSCADARMLWPWFDASSPPERVASPSFCVVDLLPSENEVSRERLQKEKRKLKARETNLVE